MVAKQSLTLKNAYKSSYAIAMRGNLSWIFQFLALPKQLQLSFSAIIAFLKQTQKIALDSKLSTKDKNNILRQYHDLIASIGSDLQPSTKSPTILALTDTILGYDLPVNLFLPRIQALLMDNEIEAYYDFEELLNFCQELTHGIVKAMLKIAKIADPLININLDFLATSIQMGSILLHETNILEGKSSRAHRKTYIPLKDLAALSVPINDVYTLTYKDNVEIANPLMNTLILRLHKITQQGQKLPQYVAPAFTKIAKRIVNTANSQVESLVKTQEKFSLESIY